MNTTNESTNQTTNQSNSLKLESLIQEYNLLLNEYQQIYQSYLNSLNSQVNDGSNNNHSSQWTSVNNTAFWGTGGLSEGPTSDISGCQNMCVASSSCTGATFDPSNNYCWTRSGQGSIVVSSTNEVAIVPKSIEYMMALKILNFEMLLVNEEIIQLSKQMPLTNSETESQISSQTLQNNYQQLMMDRKMIENVLAEKSLLNEEIKDTTLTVTHYSYLYFFLFLVLLFLIGLIFRNLLFSSKSNSNSSLERNYMMGGMNKSYNKIIKFMNQMFTIYI